MRIKSVRKTDGSEFFSFETGLLEGNLKIKN